MYLAMKDFCKEEGIDFCGLTGQLDLTEWPDLCIADLQEALLNDIADWEEEKKKVIVCATECDSNGALTMEILHLLCKKPVLFADLRHYHEDRGLFDLVNSGQHAPWLAEQSDDYRVNWKKVRLMPAMDFYFAAGGASVQFYAKPADVVTFARIVRIRGEFVMHMFTGSFEALSEEEEEELGKLTTYSWPHAYARFNCDLENFCETFSANHIHAAIGNYIPELIAACRSLDIEPVVLR
jgi:L-fucose isomerase